MTEDYYSIDYETYSPVDIRKTNVFVYVEHPEAELLIMAISKNGKKPVVWDCLNGGDEAVSLLTEAVATRSPIWAHNAQFEYAASQRFIPGTFNLLPPHIEQWHCSAALCRLAAIPSSLADSGSFLNISMQKQADGIRLINKFCVPRKPTKGDSRTRILPQDDPEDFQKFIEYCVRDVEAELQVHDRLKSITLDNSFVQRGFTSDLRMNARGIPVNRKALESADALIKAYDEELIPMFRRATSSPGDYVDLPITGQRKKPKTMWLDEGFNPTQIETMKVWLKQRGFTGTDLTDETVTVWAMPPLRDQLTPQAQAALHIYSLLGSASIKKISSMLSLASADGYVRGGLLVYGAERTHRWTGRGIQPQNFARPSISFTVLAYLYICMGASREVLEDMFGDLYDVLSSCIRHFIQPHDGRMVLQADYSAIEARIAPWLCDEEETLAMFRRGDPIYEVMSSRIFGCTLADVTKDQRFLGKQAVLGCTYNMGPPKFRATCESYGFRPSAEMVEEYKPKHHEFVNRQLHKIQKKIEMEFQKKGKPVPQKYLTKEGLHKVALKLKGWKTLYPETFEEWYEFTYDELAERAVSTWRKNNPKVVAMWRALDDAAKTIIQNPEESRTCGKLHLYHSDKHGFPALFVRLPSGHELVYPRPSVITDETKGWGTKIKFWGKLPNSSGQWGWCYTYGGKLLENATQATAGDVIREGVFAAEAEGYDPFMLVHDEMLATQKPGQTHERLCELLCDMPEWADGLPLAAEGSTIPFYKK